MENEQIENENTIIQEQIEMENTETLSEQESSTDIGDTEGTTTESEGNIVSNNDNSESFSDTTSYVIDETQYNTIIQNINMINQLGIIQVMFLFTIFMYLFIHFSIERRKF